MSGGSTPRFKKLNRDLDLNASSLTELDVEIRDLRDNASEMEVLTEKLKGLQQTSGPDARAVNEAHAHKALREKERKTIEDLRGDLRRCHGEVKSLFSTWVRRFESRIDSDVAGGPNRDVFRALSDQIDQLTALLERGVETIGERVDTANGVVETKGKELAESHAQQEAEYRELVAKTQEETGRVTERNQLQARYANAASAKKELELKEDERRKKELDSTPGGQPPFDAPRRALRAAQAGR